MFSECTVNSSEISLEVSELDFRVTGEVNWGGSEVFCRKNTWIKVKKVKTAWDEMKQNQRVQERGFDRGSGLMISPVPGPWWMGGGCGGLDVTRPNGGHPQCSGVGTISQPVYIASNETLALIQTVIIRTISVEFRLAGFKSISGTLRDKKPRVHTQITQRKCAMTPAHTLY